MLEAENLMVKLKDYVTFLAALREVDAGRWMDPISAGSWSSHDIVSHIMMWDKNFLETIVPKLLNQEPVNLEEDLDIQGFNNLAVEYGKTLNQTKLIDEAIYYRLEIVSQLRKLPKQAFLTVFPGRDSFTLGTFLTDLFVSHDEHHKEQIQRFLFTVQ